MIKRTVIYLMLLAFSLPAMADEGMWLPLWLNLKEIEKMQKLGLQIPYDQIYNHSQPSLKDAVVSLDGGSCTAEFVSAKGLLMTNHHCGFENIQEHSSVANDYIKDGFWARSYAEELPNPGKTATLLVRAHDITYLFEPLLKLAADEKARMSAVDSLKTLFESGAADSTQLEAHIASFYNDSKFVLFLTQTYRDVRLVGTPPLHIGNFGGEFDNWTWPRHTGDFSLFRVYCAPDGKSADFSENNVPYTPKKFLSISLQGYNEGDFSMIMGYPGNTNRYASSADITALRNAQNPIVNEVRTLKQNLLKARMAQSPTLAIQYAAKYDQSANYQKYALGQNQGIDKLSLIDSRKQMEDKLQLLLTGIGDTSAVNLMNKNAAFTNRVTDVLEAVKLFEEAMMQGPDLLYFALQYLNQLFELKQTHPNDDSYATKKKELNELLQKHFKDYDVNVDKDVFVVMLQYAQDKKREKSLPMSFVPKKYESKSAKAYADYLYGKTIFTNRAVLESMVDGKIAKSLAKDPLLLLLQMQYQQYSELSVAIDALNELQNLTGRELFAAYHVIYPDSSFYPDANSTMRLSYGNVKSYEPRDGVRYGNFTTTDGILDKIDPAVKEFAVPSTTSDLYRSANDVKYLDNGKLHTCFITTNDITGGNSGSPVLNSKGQLIGLAFDGNWEGMTSDIAYNIKQQRTICVDIRYVLWTIEHVGLAPHLIKEMELR